VGAILNHPKASGNSREGLFFRLLFATAARPGELAAARKSWYRPDPPQIVIPRTKNEDERIVLIPDSLADFFDYYVKMDETGSDYIFSSRSRAKNAEGDHDWVPFNYASHWRVIVKDLGLRGLVVPHMARHEAISRLFERTDLTEGAIAAISGHRSAQALWRYKHYRSEHSRPAVNALDNIYRQASLGKPVEMLPGEKFKLGAPKKTPRSKRGANLGVFPKSSGTRHLAPLPDASPSASRKLPQGKTKV
jgi:integrase